jgi:hypothetical protein
MYIIKNNNIKFVMSSTNTVSDKYVSIYISKYTARHELPRETITFVLPNIKYRTYKQNGTSNNYISNPTFKVPNGTTNFCEEA